MTKDHAKRLDKAAESCGQSRQAFVMATLLAEIAEIEERSRMKKLSVVRNSDTLAPLQQSSQGTSTEDVPSTGMSISAAIRQQREIDAPVAAAPPPNGQVVVHVGNGNAQNGAGEIDRLAAYVAQGRDFERGTRLRTALGILSATAATAEEEKVLAARLDEAVAAKAKTNGSGGLVRAAHVVFDHLTGIFDK
jgi:hypothetical protein